MRRDKGINVFLLFTLLAMLFVYYCPIYFSVGGIQVRTVSLPERISSLGFVLLWLVLCVYSAWKKRISLVVGGIFFALMAYIPEWVLPHLAVPAGSTKSPVPGADELKFLFNRMYELINAPLAGVSLLVSHKMASNLGKSLLPILVLSYIGTQLFRFYRNEYLAAQLHIEDVAYSSNPDLARELANTPKNSFEANQEPIRNAPPPAIETDSSQLKLPEPDALLTEDSPILLPEDNEQTRMHFPPLK